VSTRHLCTYSRHQPPPPPPLSFPPRTHFLYVSYSRATRPLISSIHPPPSTKCLSHLCFGRFDLHLHASTSRLRLLGKADFPSSLVLSIVRGIVIPRHRDHLLLFFYHLSDCPTTATAAATLTWAFDSTCKERRTKTRKVHGLRPTVSAGVQYRHNLVNRAAHLCLILEPNEPDQVPRYLLVSDESALSRFTQKNFPPGRTGRQNKTLK
jgi:hypothetical protein